MTGGVRRASPAAPVDLLTRLVFVLFVRREQA